MPTIVTATQLRQVLGVSVSLYSDAYLDDIIDTAETVVLPMLKELTAPATYVGNSAVESAVLAVSVEVFQSRIAPGGAIEGVDFSVSPYRLGRSLFNRVSGLLGSLIDVETMVQ